MDKKVVYIFIDASNLWEAFKAKGKFLDFDKAIKYIKEKFDATNVKAFYYTAYPAEGTRTYNLDGKHKFFTYLQKRLKFEVIKKEIKRIRDRTSKLFTIRPSRRKEQGPIIWM